MRDVGRYELVHERLLRPHQLQRRGARLPAAPRLHDLVSRFRSGHVRSVAAPVLASVAVAAVLSAPAGCGARTGLPVGERAFVVDAAAPLDASPDVIDASELPEGAVPCTPGRFPLQRFSVDMMLLIDRSGSMSYNIDGVSQTLPRKWDDMHDALAATLPAVQTSVNIGAYAFPERYVGTDVHGCAMSSTIDLYPGPNQAGDVLALFTNTD